MTNAPDNLFFKLASYSQSCFANSLSLYKHFELHVAKVILRYDDNFIPDSVIPVRFVWMAGFRLSLARKRSEIQSCQVYIDDPDLPDIYWTVVTVSRMCQC